MPLIDLEKTTKVFDYNLHAYLEKHRIIINQGGTSSSKTYSTLQLLYLIALKSKTPILISVVSRALPHLKLGAMRDFDKILLSWGEIPDKIKNKTDNYYKIGKSIIEFFGTEDLGKVHGPRRDILYINEANHVKHDVFDQLAIRTKSTIFIDYNPVQEFWVQTDIIPNEPHKFIKSTYLDNGFLSEDIKRAIESKRSNENWWKVYGLGELGQLEGSILKDWEYGDFDTSLPYAYGLDFGFSPDPDAMVKIAIDHKKKIIYADEIIYNTGQSLNDLIASIPATKTDYIIADSAEPRLIFDLSKYFNIKAVKKYPGSVAQMLKVMQDYKIIITDKSYNLAKELNNYIWNDKKSGVPIDAYNHLIDAMRYVCMALIGKKDKVYSKAG